MKHAPRHLQPGQRIRVLIVDDSVVIRRLITHALERDPTLEVAGFAPNGAAALSRIEQLSPDVVTLDIEMPGMDGLETLRHIRRSHPDLLVLMVSALTERGAAITMEALARGANDYATKPAQAGSLTQSLQALEKNLIPRIKQFFTLTATASHPASELIHTLPPASSGPAIYRPGPQIAVIGVSTGGPNALCQILPQFPAGFPLPVLIVQHMPPIFTRHLANRLNDLSAVHVEEATDGALLAPGKALVAPGGFHLRLQRRRQHVIAALDQTAPENFCRPAVDVTLQSVAETYGGGAIVTILTGMGQDGLAGCRRLRPLGAQIIAQDQATSVVWGMPGAVVRNGLADVIVPLPAIVPEIVRRVRCFTVQVPA